jgi:hypothetical protein
MPGGNGYLKSISADALLMPAPYGATLGRIAGHSRVAQYGHTPAGTANTDVWEGGGLYPFQAAATVLEILSASASDTAAGTGARTFTITGLDNNFNPISEVITLNGVTPVQTVNSYRRVNGLVIASAGSGNTNAGDVTLRVTGAGATQALARAGYGYAKQAVYTVPTGFTLLVTDLLLEVGGLPAIADNITFAFCRVNASGLFIITNEYPTGPLIPVERVIFTGAMVTQTQAVVIRVVANNTSVSGYAAINGILVDNTQLV